MSKLERIKRLVAPAPAFVEPKKKSSGSWAKYAHKQVGPEAMRITRPFKRSPKKRGSAWRGNNRLFQKDDEK